MMWRLYLRVRARYDIGIAWLVDEVRFQRIGELVKRGERNKQDGWKEASIIMKWESSDQSFSTWCGWPDRDHVSGGGMQYE